ncbi:MAG: cobalt-precorrin-5B (C(1))-methyltransferase CbiD [Candidatus Omnitrophota bacterium]|nr:cobalt-precorrin-5B (C(1))-methyltransferase CbiD [Candidatus Omnitrophota bacterium]
MKNKRSITNAECPIEDKKFNSALRTPHSALKTGYTTGSCAQAAAKGATYMLVSQKLLKSVDIVTPSGKRLNLKLVGQKIGRNFAQCGVIKDSGSDPYDVTNRIKIYAKVAFTRKPGIAITGGKGIGRVTKPGLPIGIGEYAINPTPRKMIIDEVRNAECGMRNEKIKNTVFKNGIEVIISAPEGEKIAKRTFNPQIGILGGISIIGTTGIVEPKSTQGYKTSLSLQLDVLKAQGYKKPALVLGYVGEKFCKEKLNLTPDSIIKIGDHVGFMLKECVKKDIKEVTLAGYIGKLVKLTNNQFNTHIDQGDKRISTIAKYAKRCGAKKAVIDEILRQATAEATIDILQKNRINKVFKKIASDIIIAIKHLTHNKLKVNCMLLSLDGEVLAEMRV